MHRHRACDSQGERKRKADQPTDFFFFFLVLDLSYFVADCQHWCCTLSDLNAVNHAPCSIRGQKICSGSPQQASVYSIYEKIFFGCCCCLQILVSYGDQQLKFFFHEVHFFSVSRCAKFWVNGGTGQALTVSCLHSPPSSPRFLNLFSTSVKTTLC